MCVFETLYFLTSITTEGNHTIIPDHLMLSPAPLRTWLWQDFEQLYPYFQCLVIRSLELIREATLKAVEAQYQVQEEFLKNPDAPRFLHYKQKQPNDEDRQRAMNAMKSHLAQARLCYNRHHCIADLFRGALGKKKKKIHGPRFII